MLDELSSKINSADNKTRKGVRCGERPEKTICSAQSAINASGCRLELILAAYKVTFYGPLLVLVVDAKEYTGQVSLL